MQTCIWPSWCHCHSLNLASVKSRLVLPFWYWLARVVPEKGLLNGCVCVIPIDSSTRSSVHVSMLSIQAVRGLPRLRESGIVPCIISSSWCDHSMLASLLWRCRTVPSLSQLCYEPTHLFSLLSIQPTESFLVLSSQRHQDEFLHSSGRPEYTIVWLSSVVKCPCSSHLNDLTSDNPHISTPNLTISSPSSWTLPSCCILRIFQAPSLLHSCSCLSPCGNILVFFIMVDPVTNFRPCPGCSTGDADLV